MRIANWLPGCLSVGMVVGTVEAAGCDDTADNCALLWEACPT
jgi:hypothetical protein